MWGVCTLFWPFLTGLQMKGRTRAGGTREGWKAARIQAVDLSKGVIFFNVLISRHL